MSDLRIASLKILCVDDNHDVADTMSELLSLVGHETKACYDGVTALDQFDEFRPHVCLIDLNMPGMNGDELAVKLREAGRPVKLVAITARSDEAGSRRIRAAGFDRHFIKPVSLSDLLAAIGS